MKYTNEILKINGKNCKQVNKTVAKKVYNQNKDIYLYPCNMRLQNPWQGPVPFNKKETGTKFENVLNSWLFYAIPELGLYPNYFIETK